LGWVSGKRRGRSVGKMNMLGGGEKGKHERNSHSVISKKNPVLYNQNQMEGEWESRKGKRDRKRGSQWGRKGVLQSFLDSCRFVGVQGKGGELRRYGSTGGCRTSDFQELCRNSRKQKDRAESSFSMGGAFTGVRKGGAFQKKMLRHCSRNLGTL